MKSKDTLSIAMLYLINTPAPSPDRAPPKDPYDFGPDQGCWLCLKRSGKRFMDLDMDSDFGLWLGLHKDGKYVVGIRSASGTSLTGCEVFDSMDEVKREWMLD